MIWAMLNWVLAPPLRRSSIRASISASVTRIRLATSRSRSRSTIIWSLMLERNFAYSMPSRRSRSRSCGIVSWFCAATLATARSSSDSSIRMPLSRALVTSTRSSISTSTTSLRSAAGGGSWVRVCCASARTREIRCCTSAAVTSSWLTTATM